MDISNKMLFYSIVVAVVISIGGTIVSLNKLSQIVPLTMITGMAGINTSTVQLTITGVTEVNFTTATIDFGTGYVSGDHNNCTMDSDSNVNAGCLSGWASQADAPLVLENIGNTQVEIDLFIGKNATTLLGGTEAVNSYQLKVGSTESGCGGNYIISSYTEVNHTFRGLNASGELEYPNGITICANGNELAAGSAADTITFDAKFIVPDDATTGAKTDTLNVTATAS